MKRCLTLAAAVYNKAKAIVGVESIQSSLASLHTE